MAYNLLFVSENERDQIKRYRIKKFLNDLQMHTHTHLRIEGSECYEASRKKNTAHTLCQPFPTQSCECVFHRSFLQNSVFFVFHWIYAFFWLCKKITANQKQHSDWMYALHFDASHLHFTRKNCSIQIDLVDFSSLADFFSAFVCIVCCVEYIDGFVFIPISMDECNWDEHSILHSLMSVTCIMAISLTYICSTRALWHQGCHFCSAYFFVADAVVVAWIGLTTWSDWFMYVAITLFRSLLWIYPMIFAP